jgi:hypothetical protein
MKQECGRISYIRLGVFISVYTLVWLRCEPPYHEGAVLRSHLVSGYSGVSASSGANSGQQQTAPNKSDHSDMSSLEQYNAPRGPRAPLVPPVAASCAKRIFPSGVRDREEVSQYLLRIDDGSGLLMKGGILNIYPSSVGRGRS